MKLIFSLILLLFYSFVYSQEDIKNEILLQLDEESWEELEEMKIDFSKLFLNAQSHTHPVEIANKRIEFPKDMPYTVIFLVEESADTDATIKKRQIIYTFDLHHIKKTSLSKIRDGNLITIDFHKNQFAKIEVVMAGKIMKTLETESIEIAAPDQNTKESQDLIIEMRNFCEYLSRG